MSKGLRKCHPDVSQSRRPTIDCMSLSGALVQATNLCSCCTMRAIFSSGIEIDHVSTEIRHPIQSTSTSNAALCHDIGIPKMRNSTTKSDAHKGDEMRSSHASKSSTYCHNAWPWARSAWLVRTIKPATLPQYQPLARAPKFSVIQRYNFPLAWKHSMPPSFGSMRMRRCALETSSVSWIICCLAIESGAHTMTSEMRGRVMWLGITVLGVTLLMELSTTSRGDRPSAITTPSFPTAVR